MGAMEDLMREALSKREVARALRLNAPGLSLVEARTQLLRYASDLEHEADRLEAKARALKG